MGQIAFQTKRYSLARDQFSYLERKWRRTPDHPMVLYDLMAVEFESDRRWLGCRAARKLYSLYPEYSKIDSWGIYLRLAMYKNKPIHCEATSAEAKTRIDRWRRAGQQFRARKEIADLRKILGPDMYYQVDHMLVDFLASEGDVEEALQIHLKYYAEMKNNFGYQMLLGKAAARSGEFKTAIGAYQEAYRLNPRSSSGRQALFHSAFLSYQSPDYDGAARRFEEIISKFPRSGLSRDAFWHLGWIRYLRGDYVGAIDKLDSILEQKSNRGTRRLWRSFPSKTKRKSSRP
jgi:soluble lytic murein transglycosylase